MARVIVVTSGKGGVGKTTTTSNIGMSLARLGHSTLLIDADVGLRNLDLLLGLENRIIYTGLDVLNQTCRLEQAIIQDKRQSKLAFFPLSSNRAEVPVTSEQINKLIELIKVDYEYILIDSPAGIDNGFQTAIQCADEAIVVVTPEVIAMDTSPDTVVIPTVKEVDSMAVGCFLILETPLYPLRLEIVPSVSVEVNTSEKSAP